MPFEDEKIKKKNNKGGKKYTDKNINRRKEIFSRNKNKK